MDDHKPADTMTSHVETMTEKPSAQFVSPPSEVDREERVTAKAWASIFVSVGQRAQRTCTLNFLQFLALSFGTPFWATPVTAALSAQLFARFGSGELSAWVIPCMSVFRVSTLIS